MTLYEAILLLRARWPWLLIVPGVMASLIVGQRFVVPPDAEARAVIRVEVPGRVRAVLNSRTFAERITAAGRLVATQDKGDGHLVDLTATAPAPTEALRMLAAAIETIGRDEVAQHQYQEGHRSARLRRALEEQAAVMQRRDPFAVLDYARVTDRLASLRAETRTSEADAVIVVEGPTLVPHALPLRRAFTAALVGLGLVCGAVFLRAWWIAECTARPPGR